LEILNYNYMSELNSFKIYSLAIFHLLMPKIIKRKFYFKTSSAENIAIGTAMNRIWYWRSFIRTCRLENKIIFTNKVTYSTLPND